MPYNTYLLHLWMYIQLSPLSCCKNIKLFNYIVQKSLTANAVLAGFIVKNKSNDQTVLTI